jgi:hypothetical protein
MKNKLKILVMFAVIFCMSFVPDYTHELFGDWQCNGGKVEYINNNLIREGCLYSHDTHGPSWHWGFRHWLWVIAGLTFTIWTIIDTVSDEKSK